MTYVSLRAAVIGAILCMVVAGPYGCRKKSDAPPPPPTNVASPFEHSRADLHNRRIHAPPTAWKGVEDLAVGEHFACGLASGRVYCWGQGRFGELGLGEDKTHSLVPEGPLNGLESVVQISANRGFACAVTRDGEAYCWGNNVHGQLGDGTTDNRFKPTQVKGLHSVKQVAAGYRHACAVTDAGRVYCWGGNKHGQIGREEHATIPSPAHVSGLGYAVQVAAGTASSCARMRTGHVECWGINRYGELGRGLPPDTLEQSARARRVQTITGAIDLAGYANTYCAATQNGYAYCWGGKKKLSARAMRHRKRRIAANLPVESLPSIGSVDQMKGISDVQQVAAGRGFACALEQSGQAYCWGKNQYAQLGIGSESDAESPAPMAGVTEAEQLIAGSRNTCVIDPDGRAFCAGANGQGEIGDGGTSTALTPKPVLRPESATMPPTHPDTP